MGEGWFRIQIGGLNEQFILIGCPRHFGGCQAPLARGPALKNVSHPKVEWGLICSPAH